MCVAEYVTIIIRIAKIELCIIFRKGTYGVHKNTLLHIIDGQNVIQFCNHLLKMFSITCILKFYKIHFAKNIGLFKLKDKYQVN